LKCLKCGSEIFRIRTQGESEIIECANCNDHVATVPNLKEVTQGKLRLRIKKRNGYEKTFYY
jgi:hypothetical protein